MFEICLCKNSVLPIKRDNIKNDCYDTFQAYLFVAYLVLAILVSKSIIILLFCMISIYITAYNFELKNIVMVI